MGPMWTHGMMSLEENKIVGGLSGQKGELSSPFWLRRAVRERGEQVLKNGGFLERESTTSL